MDFNKIIDNREKTLNIDASGISLNNLEGDYLIPPGQISFFATIQPPLGWLECNGALIERNDYPDLYNAIGNTWGGVDLCFNLPDFRNKFLRVWDNGKNIDNNREFAKEQNSMEKSHTHTLNPKHTHSISFNNNNDGKHTHHVYADTQQGEYWDERNGGHSRWNNRTDVGGGNKDRYAAITMWRSGGSGRDYGDSTYKPHTFTSAEGSLHHHYFDFNSSPASININNYGNNNSIIKNKSMLCCIKY